MSGTTPLSETNFSANLLWTFVKIGRKRAHMTDLLKSTRNAEGQLQPEKGRHSSLRYDLKAVFQMPKRPRSHELEDISRNRLHGIFEGVGWTVEDVAKDYGEDLLVRIFENGVATPLKFYVQAKATDNITRYLKGNANALHIQLGKEHLDQWNVFHDPVILTIMDSRSENIYWGCVQDILARRSRSKGSGGRRVASISISRNSLLDDEGLRRILSITRLRHDRMAREERGAQVLKELLENRLGVEVEYSPHEGIVLVFDPTEGGEAILFGKTLSKVLELAEEFNKTPQEIFDLAIESLKGLFEVHEKTGAFPVTNPTTGKLEMIKMTNHELIRYLSEKIVRFREEV